MIRTLTLNPAVDKTVTIERFAVGQVNRIGSVRLDAGGKGLNVARVLHRASAPVVAVAPVGGEGGRFLAERLRLEGIPADLIPVRGETRTNLKVVDPILGSHTDINEPGPILSDAEIDEIGQRLLRGLAPGDWVVFSGSVPAGIDKGVYARWMTHAHSLGARTVLDADGEAFRLGLAAGPDLVKPNRAELEAWAGNPIGDELSLFTAVRDLKVAGARTVAVSLGLEGAWLFHGEGAWFAPGLPVIAQSTVGAGDAMVAGLSWGLSTHLTASNVLAQAVAWATACVVLPGTAAGNPRDSGSYLEQVQVRSVEAWAEFLHSAPRR